MSMGGEALYFLSLSVCVSKKKGREDGTAFVVVVRD
jgi:hypothetical protein